MISPDSLNDVALAKLLRTASTGDFLFKQGEKSNAMYLIMDGTVVLMLKTSHHERRVGTVGPGEMVGEKAILSDSPYKHNYSAIAQSPVTMLELDKSSLKLIQTRMPDFTLKMLRRVTDRLDEANEFIGILQLKDAAERFIQYLVFFCRFHCKKSPQGTEISITQEEIQIAANLGKEFVEESLKLLVTQKILKRQTNGFLVPDENLLISYLPTLKDRLAA